MKHDRDILFRRVSAYVSQIRSLREFFIGGAPASPTNREIIARCLEAWLFLIEDLMLRSRFGEPARIKRMDNFFHAFIQTDFLALVELLDTVYSLLITDEYLGNLDGFKHLLDSNDAWVHWRMILSPLNGSIYEVLKSRSVTRRADLLVDLAHFLRFPRKLVLQDIGLEEQAIKDYIETERELDTVTIDPTMLKGIRGIVTEWFRDFRITGLLPSHGPGSVAEGSLTPKEKFERLTVDARIRVLLGNSSGPSEVQSYFPLPLRDGLVRRSRTVFVPKTTSKLRTISMEPIALQYLQQGVMYALYEYIKRHPILGHHIRLDDQMQNQVWALVGSAYQTYGTIDLSKASDSVSWNLVREIFGGVPHLYKWLLGTRSVETLLPDGEVLTLKKFAPMGSALCFPIECIIFGAIAEYASRIAVDPREAFEPFWSVYGDDIIVHSRAYETTVSTLESLGFHVNTTKSYNTGFYRESCGKEYYNGVDITPLYYRIPFYRRRVTPSAFGSWCSAANNAMLHRLPMYRLFFVTKILRYARRVGPYFTSNPEISPYLYSPSPTNFHVRRKWHKDWQVAVGRFVSVKCKPRDESISDDNLRYHMKLVDLAKRPRGVLSSSDEESSPYAVHGCVEFFSSTTLPLIPYNRPSRTAAWDW